MVEFSSWEMPVYYTTPIDEHLTVRDKAGLFDICHMGELFIKGRDAFSLIQKLITKDLDKLEDGMAFYSAMCLENGGIIDDLLVYQFNKNKFMLVVNAANAKKDFDWILKNKKGILGGKLLETLPQKPPLSAENTDSKNSDNTNPDTFQDVIVTDKTAETAKLDLQGPKSEEILQKLTDADLKSLKRFHFIESSVNNIPAIISRTGYTGEDGFELYFSSEQAVKLWNTLLESGKDAGLKPIGLGARDTLRIEACYSLYGHELTESVNPLEAGISFVVSFNKADFIGKPSLEKIKQDGLKQKIAAFVIA